MSKKLESDPEGLVDRRNLLKGAALAGLGAMTIGASGAVGSTDANVKVSTGATIQDLVQQMAQDPEFAQGVISEPTRFQAQYNLSRRAVESLRGLRLEDFKHIQIEDARSFAAGALTVATKARVDFEVAGDSCYYFG